MRAIKELLTIVRDSLSEGEKVGYFNSGICGEIKDLYCWSVISYSEYVLLLEYIRNRKPEIDGQYYRFTKNIFWEGKDYWWSLMMYVQKTRQIRIDYINTLIEEI